VLKLFLLQLGDLSKLLIVNFLLPVINCRDLLVFGELTDAMFVFRCENSFKIAINFEVVKQHVII
jgi:hypothetical protein